MYFAVKFLKMKSKKVAIIGASGYSGEELVQLLLEPSARGTGRRHLAPKCRANAGAGFPEIRQPSEIQDAPLHRAERRNCSRSRRTWFFSRCRTASPPNTPCRCSNAGCVVIDLSADFRLKSAEIYKEFYAHDHPAPELLKKSVYGLPEIYREQIKKSLLIASPGCYPTSILLPVIPLLKAGLIKPTGIIADSLSGVSGAGRKAEMDYLFCECNESVRPYGVPKHRHLSEIEEQLSLAAGTQSR